MQGPGQAGPTGQRTCWAARQPEAKDKQTLEPPDGVLIECRRSAQLQCDYFHSHTVATVFPSASTSYSCTATIPFKFENFAEVVRK